MGEERPEGSDPVRRILQRLAWQLEGLAYRLPGWGGRPGKGLGPRVFLAAAGLYDRLEARRHYMKMGQRRAWCGVKPRESYAEWRMVTCERCLEVREGLA